MPRSRLAPLVAALVLLVAAGCSGDDGDDGAAGETLVGEPSAELTTTVLTLDDGSTDDLLGLAAGRPMVVNFWASWCAPCIREMPDFEAVHAELGGEVAFVGVNVDDRPEDRADMIERTGITYTVAVDDGAFAETAGAINLPTTLVLDAAGTVVETHLGAMSADQLRAAIAEAAAA